MKTVREKIWNLVGHGDEAMKTFLGAYPAVDEYVSKKFPEKNFSNIPVYLVASQRMDKNGFMGVGGLYDPESKQILIRRSWHHKEQTSRFDVCLNRYRARVEREDIIVHEFMHAASHLINRASRKYKNMEEKFAYQECIGFYRRKGMSDEEIINNNFLPFFIQEVLTSRPRMLNVMFNFRDATGQENASSKLDLPYKRFYKYLNTNAFLITKHIVAMARDMASAMIENKDKKDISLKNKKIRNILDPVGF